MTQAIRQILACMACLLPLFACAAEPQPIISNAWVALAPPNAPTSSAYLVIQSPVDDRLTGVSTPIAGEVQIHHHSGSGNLMRMERLPSLAVPANTTVTLEPGGLHLMLFRLEKQLSDGEEVRFTLQFETAGAVEVVAVVRDPRSTAS